MMSIILFDGECNLCNQSVVFVIKKDTENHFRFASRQSKIGNQLLDQYKIDKNIDSIIVIDNDTVYLESDAILHICKYIKRWRILCIFSIFPKLIRDDFYKGFAKNRYKWFGKKEQCMIPTPEIKKRFLE
ncbi:thiol-disulfide oxidoreductase DCC family protein [Lysinibacillus xylanilyticus]|uniref:thiol-disulfide oxidoreductase DCC family protein n=1 Tax=Lysinibacillus xylanilyticus TaxID=582475 RepID=UPI003824CDE2